MGATAASPSPRDARRAGVMFVAGMLALMVVVELVDSVDSHRLDLHGIVPRTDNGLLGIIFAPFLHANWSHLFGNAVPFFILGGVIALGGLARVALVTAIVALVSGLGVWLVASGHSVHIGASGVVFGYAAYLIARGLFSRSLLQLAVGALVVLVYGFALLGSLFPHPGISWQGHLFGAVGGVVAARLLAPRRGEATAPGRVGPAGPALPGYR